ncbi:MAG TPA: extracellular solute-binding protein [Acidisoma sp.]|uniref:extracellular solute-binding protein n=1 Tax=Acidisoma sp. TaxID=1872115 RepID=UPI002C444631|nr:extracellular solute-binding protein [Acidisoma sp.]HTH99626.1 extracellular solute-binding protein [Acidisoma sp.]
MLKAMIGTVSLAAMLLATTAVVQAHTVIKIVHEETNPTEVALWKRIAADYEKLHPDVTVTYQYLENEAYKAKLPTMLQSSDRPDIIWSWGGGVMRAQIDAGYLRPLGAAAQAVVPNMIPADAAAYKVDGKYYGLPILHSEVCFFYNKELFAKAGVDANQIKTWSEFLAAVKKIKAAGITPITVGAGEKWPMHFYWAYLAMREGGARVIDEARAGKDGGFVAPAFVEAGQRLQELAALHPFQPGYVGTLALQAAGQFGDGRAAMQLMGNWLLNTQAGNAANGKGLPDSNIGIFGFPVVAGAPGKATDELGGVNGWLVTKTAPAAADDFLAFFFQPKYQQQAAVEGDYIPALAGTSAFIKDPIIRQIAISLEHATALQIFFDQALGPSVGRVVNDVSVAVAAGQMGPKAGVEAVQQAWEDEQ